MATETGPWAFSRGPWPPYVVFGAPTREAARKTAQGGTSVPVVAMAHVPTDGYVAVSWRA